MTMGPDELAEWVARSTAASGVPLRLEDPEVCERVARILLPNDTGPPDVRTAPSRGAVLTGSHQAIDRGSRYNAESSIRVDR